MYGFVSGRQVSWMTGLGFTNPVGQGEWDMCLGCGVWVVSVWSEWETWKCGVMSMCVV